MRLTSDSPVPLIRPTRVAGLHRAPDGWSLVIVAREDEQVRILHAESLRAGDTEAVRRAVSTHRAQRLVRVIPADETIVRTIELPAGDEASARSAIGLMAEAQLPDAIEPHRRGGDLLTLPASAADQRSAMLCGWVEKGTPQRLLGDDDEETWAPAGGAIAALISLDPRRLWDDEPGWGVASDGQGSVSAVVADASGTRVRGGRIAHIDTLLEEMGADAPMHAGRRVALDAATVDRVRASAPTSGESSAWVEEHALALGAAVLAVGGAGGLSSLLAEPPRYHYTLPQRTALWLRTPRNARAIVALGLALLVLAPAGLIYARHQILTGKLRQAEETFNAEDQARDDELVRNRVFASELQQRRMPHTKIIAAIADVMPLGALPGGEDEQSDPLGVQISELSIKGGSVTIKGEAASRDLGFAFTGALSRLDLFGSSSPDFKDIAGSDRVSFDLVAPIRSTTSIISVTGGYEDTPYAVRLHGEQARAFDYGTLDRTDETASAGTSGASASGTGRTRRAAFNSGAGAEEEEETLPEVLGAEAIEQMDLRTTRAAWAKRKAVVNRSGLDEEARRAMQQDIELLEARLRALR